MRYRDAAAHAGRAEILALEEFGQDALRRDAEDLARRLGKLVQKLLLIGGDDVDVDFGWRRKSETFMGLLCRVCGRITWGRTAALMTAQSGARSR